MTGAPDHQETRAPSATVELSYDVWTAMLAALGLHPNEGGHVMRDAVVELADTVARVGRVLGLPDNVESNVMVDAVREAVRAPRGTQLARPPQGVERHVEEIRHEALREIAQAVFAPAHIPVGTPPERIVEPYPHEVVTRVRQVVAALRAVDDEFGGRGRTMEDLLAPEALETLLGQLRQERVVRERQQDALLKLARLFAPPGDVEAAAGLVADPARLAAEACQRDDAWRHAVQSTYDLLATLHPDAGGEVFTRPGVDVTSELRALAGMIRQRHADEIQAIRTYERGRLYAAARAVLGGAAVVPTEPDEVVSAVVEHVAHDDDRMNELDVAVRAQAEVLRRDLLLEVLPVAGEQGEPGSGEEWSRTDGADRAVWLYRVGLARWAVEKMGQD